MEQASLLQDKTKRYMTQGRRDVKKSAWPDPLHFYMIFRMRSEGYFSYDYACEIAICTTTAKSTHAG
jgi:hypothetical protein